MPNIKSISNKLYLSLQILIAASAAIFLGMYVLYTIHDAIVFNRDLKCIKVEYAKAESKLRNSKLSPAEEGEIAELCKLEPLSELETANRALCEKSIKTLQLYRKDLVDDLEADDAKHESKTPTKKPPFDPTKPFTVVESNLLDVSRLTPIQFKELEEEYGGHSINGLNALMLDSDVLKKTCNMELQQKTLFALTTWGLGSENLTLWFRNFELLKTSILLLSVFIVLIALKSWLKWLAK
jgi:hypothetical protein